MPRPNPVQRRSVFAMLATLVLSPVPSLVADRYNYTWSLLLFVMPSALILGWFASTRDEELRPVRKAFWLTLGLLVPMGFLLNLLFAGHFFVYRNTGAVLGLYVPGLTLHGWDWALKFPVEEFGFYGLGFFTMLLIYLWADATFLRRDHVTRARYHGQGKVLQFAVVPALVALTVVALGIAYKQSHGGGFPGYLTFLMCVPFVLALTLYKVARDVVNWPAFALMLLYILGLSVLWEASLALPGQWWDYRHEQMVGLYVARWTRLPVEAVLVWFLAAFATAIVFEAAKAFIYHPATSWRHKLLVAPAALAPAPGPQGAAA